MADDHTQTVWTNWSAFSHESACSYVKQFFLGTGPLLGFTLTLSSNYGNLLIGGLAIWVTYVVSHLWDLICFILHRLLTSDREDMLYHQIQALLRTGLSSLTLSWRFPALVRPWRRTLPLIATCIIYAIGGIAAAVFSSRVTVNDEVLLQGKVCGWFDERYSTATFRAKNLTEKDIEAINALAVASRQLYRQGMQYVRTCYAHGSSNTESSFCGSYILPRIESEIKRNVTCPFKEGICKTKAITLASQLVDSHHHLGINAKTQDRVQVRRNTTCAPIFIENYSSHWIYDAPEANYPGEALMFYNVGPLTDNMGDPISNYTFAVSSYSSTFSPPYQLRFVMFPCYLVAMYSF
jgi:hypothetical protein